MHSSLVRALLSEIGFPESAQDLLAVDGLRSLPVRPLSGEAGTVLAFIRSEENGARADELCCTVLSLCSSSLSSVEAALDFPADALDDLFVDNRTDPDLQLLAISAQRTHRTTSAPASRLGSFGSLEDEAVRLQDRMGEGCEAEVYSVLELRNGQLHARLPPRGLLTFRVRQMWPDLDDERARQAHLLSSLARLSRRSRQHAAGNAAAQLLVACVGCDAVAEGTRRLRELWALLEPVAAGRVSPLGHTLSAGLHQAAAAGLFAGSEAMDRVHPGRALSRLAAALPGEGCVRLAELCEAAISASCRRPIVLVTPELRPWCTVGGLGTFVSHHSSALAAQLVSHHSSALAAQGAAVSVITPAYGSCAHLWAEASRPLFELLVPLGPETCTVTVRTATEHGVTTYLLQSERHFRTCYPGGDAAMRLLPAVLLARASLLLLLRLGQIEEAAEQAAPLSAAQPLALISNDWVAALVAPYARHTAWAGTASSALAEMFRPALLLHLIHNLAPGYDGQLSLPSPPPPLASTHQLPAGLLHEGGGRASPSASLNLSRAALLTADAWGTVSESYREHLLASSSFAPLLRAFHSSACISCDSGLPLERRRREVAAHGSHEQAKAELQQRCFGVEGVRPRVPLLVFLGRVAHQKGVHLLLEVLPALLSAEGTDLQVLVCGRALPDDSYAVRCAAAMAQLRAAHPTQFWAQPDAFFEPSTLATLGADFGVMPSLYEPSGLVREEFYAAGTPLVCSSSGGLADRVVTYDESTRVGTGVTYQENAHSPLMEALTTALSLYRSGDAHYETMRRNAFTAAVDVSTTALHWRCELQRLQSRRRRLRALDEEEEHRLFGCEP